jgi:phospholipid-binding lipoprotein MlaA
MFMTIFRTGGLLVLLSFVAACASGPVPADHIYDPFEETNRQIHEFNKAVDAAALAPAAAVYGAVVPEGLRDAVDNSANNLALPGQVINHVLQGEITDALQTTVRFALNSTIGIAGLFDPASEVGLFEIPTNFGETLGVYGIAEGPYLELPLIGGSTLRGALGMTVDFAIDPLRYYISSPDREYLFLLKGVDLVGDRLTYSDLVDLLLYESSDSYASQRIAYLQNMRHNLEPELVIEDLEDPFAFDY